MSYFLFFLIFFFFYPSPPTDISTLSLHDALPILGCCDFLIVSRNRVEGFIGNAVRHNRRIKNPDEAVSTSDSVVKKTQRDRKSTRLNSSHQIISYAVFCLKKKKKSKKKDTNHKHK